jgi:hypothetical protein
MRLKLTVDQENDLRGIMTILVDDCEQYMQRARQRGLTKNDALQGWVATMVASLLLIQREEKLGRAIEVDGWKN